MKIFFKMVLYLSEEMRLVVTDALYLIRLVLFEVKQALWRRQVWLSCLISFFQAEFGIFWNIYIYIENFSITSNLLFIGILAHKILLNHFTVKDKSFILLPRPVFKSNPPITSFRWEIRNRTTKFWRPISNVSYTTNGCLFTQVTSESGLLLWYRFVVEQASKLNITKEIMNVSVSITCKSYTHSSVSFIVLALRPKTLFCIVKPCKPTNQSSQQTTVWRVRFWTNSNDNGLEKRKVKQIFLCDCFMPILCL